MSSQLFTPLTVRGVTFPNRLWLASMCQYSARDGVVGSWHQAHLGAQTIGGYGLMLTEATAVVPEGRISRECPGLWRDDQRDAWRPIVDFAHEHSRKIGVQLAHAGRKASCFAPWHPVQGSVPEDEGGWLPVAPSPIAFPGYRDPAELTRGGIGDIVAAFAAAARRASVAGFDVIEIHAAHGYLLHQFLSPLSNARTDEYGGDLAGRARLLLEVVTAVRQVWPDERPLLVRFSATDWVDGGLTAADVATVARWCADRGVDLADVSSGGLVPAEIPIGPGYQVPLARQVRAEGGIATSAVGLITEAAQAEQVLRAGEADVVFVARAALRQPLLPLQWAHDLGVPADEAGWLPQYVRGALR